MIYKLYAALAAGDALASLDIQDDGVLYGALPEISVTGMDALGDVARVELSFMSTNSFTANDTRGSIATWSFSQAFLTSGGGIAGSAVGIASLLIPVHAGERIFLHATLSAGVGGKASVYMYVDDGASIDKLRPPRRRR